MLELIDRNQYTVYTVGQLYSASDCGHMVKDSFLTGSDCSWNASVVSGAQDSMKLFLLATYDNPNEIKVYMIVNISPCST